MSRSSARVWGIVSAKHESVKNKTDIGGTGAALERAAVALGASPVGCSSDDCNEGSNGEKGREADVHFVEEIEW